MYHGLRYGMWYGRGSPGFLVVAVCLFALFASFSFLERMMKGGLWLLESITRVRFPVFTSFGSFSLGCRSAYWFGCLVSG